MRSPRTPRSSSRTGRRWGSSTSTSSRAATSGPALADGDAIPRKDTAYPLRVDTLLLDLDQTVNSVDKQDLATVVDELGKGFADGGEDLQRLLDSGDALTRSATEALPETIKLIDDGRIVLDTQRDTAGDVKVFAKNFADLSETLKASDGDLRLILDRGVVASKELETLIRDNQGNLAALLANLITIGQVTTSRVDGIQQLLVTYPDVVAGGYTVVPGDGTRALRAGARPGPAGLHPGLPGHQEAHHPRHQRHQGQHRGPVHRPRGSTTSVRGAQNAPGPSSSTQLDGPLRFRRPTRIPGHGCVVGHDNTTGFGSCSSRRG